MAVIKPLVSVFALVLGFGAMALTLTIQHNPHAFTQPKILPETAEPEHLQRNVEIPLVEMAFSHTTRIDSVVRIDEVKVEGRRLGVPARAALARNDAGEMPLKVLKAPCRDGEYRLLDPHRGVRLMCPGGSL